LHRAIDARRKSIILISDDSSAWRTAYWCFGGGESLRPSKEPILAGRLCCSRRPMAAVSRTRLKALHDKRRLSGWPGQSPRSCPCPTVAGSGVRPAGGLLLTCGEIALREPRFLDGANLEQVLLSATLVCIVALGRGLSSSPGRSISRSAPWSRPALSWPPSVYLAIRS
jgi:hypothetical protein